MASVLKCDRCGKIFHLGRWPRTYKLVKLTNYLVMMNGREMDLCDDCNSELFDWLNDEKFKEEEK